MPARSLVSQPERWSGYPGYNARAVCVPHWNGGAPAPFVSCRDIRAAAVAVEIGAFMTLSTARRRALKGALACAFAAVSSLPVFADEAVLRVSAIPDEAPTELQRKFAPLGKYLEAQTGLKVVFTPVSDYAAVVEALATKKIDLAWLGGFTFVQAKIRTNGTAIPIVQRAEDAVFTSKFITADPAIKSVADLKGKTFAFGAPSSTSGSLMPRFFLQQAGLNPEKDFKNVAYSGAHDATVAFVAAGKAEAGVLNASVWDKLVEQKKVDTDKVRVFSTTPPYFDYNWTVRGDLDPALVKKLTEAFLKLDPANPEHKEILALQRASKFVPTKKENYDGIEKAAHSAGLLK
jgi:phosphonate transport system substrate-binding protein